MGEGIVRGQLLLCVSGLPGRVWGEDPNMKCLFGILASAILLSCQLPTPLAQQDFYDTQGLTITNFAVARLGVTGVVNDVAGTITAGVPWSDLSRLVPTITATGVSISPASGVVQNFYSPISYTVTSSNASKHSYLATISQTSSVHVISQGIGSLTFGNGKFIGLINSGVEGYSGQGYLSSDGVNWKSTSLPATSTLWKSIAFGNGSFVAIADFWSNSGTGSVVSADGTNWSASNLPKGNLWQSVVFGNGVFLALDGSTHSAVSQDGVSWSVYNSVPTGLSRAVYGNGVFLALDSSGYCALSTDGMVWANYGSSGSRGPIAFGNGTFVIASGAVNSLSTQTSKDGITWTTNSVAVTPFSVQVSTVFFANGLFLALQNTDQTYVVLQSPDGVNWHEVPVPLNFVSGESGDWFSLTCAAYGNGVFVTCGTEVGTLVGQASHSNDISITSP